MRYQPHQQRLSSAARIRGRCKLPQAWRVRGTLAAALATLLATDLGWACPDCAVGIVARAEVYDRDFAFNLVVAVLPFLIIGIICRGIEVAVRAALTGQKLDPGAPNSGSQNSAQLPS